MMRTEIFDRQKFNEMRDNHWEIANKLSRLFYCNLHKTEFDPLEQPCWSCWDECIIEEEFKEEVSQ